MPLVSFYWCSNEVPLRVAWVTGRFVPCLLVLIIADFGMLVGRGVVMGLLIVLKRVPLATFQILQVRVMRSVHTHAFNGVPTNNQQPTTNNQQPTTLVARLEPMASTSSSGGLVQGHTCCPARVARCFRGRTCPYRLRDACWFSHDDDPEEDPPCRVDAATSSDLLVRVRRLERIVEQIGSVLVPQILKGDVEGFQQNSVVEQIVGAPAPQTWEPIGERVQNCFPEQIVGIPVPQLMEECVQNRTQEQIVDVPVPRAMEECVQNRTPEQIVDVPVPRIMEAAVEVVRDIPLERVQN